MPTRLLNETLARLTDSGKAMLAAAKAGEWDELLALEAKRRPDMAQLEGLIAPFKQEGASLPAQISGRISGILTLENEIISLVEQVRDGIMKELQSLDSSRRLKNLYSGPRQDGLGL